MFPTKLTTLRRQIGQAKPNRYEIVTVGLRTLVSAILFTTLTGCAAPNGASPSGQNVLLFLVMILIIGGLVSAPTVYFLMHRQPRLLRALLMVSTDEEAKKIVMNAAKRVGYSTTHVYRYEDALEKLRQDASLTMIIIDDSVPQYEAGLLVSMLARLPIGIRPLILIHDSTELGATAPSYRAEAVVSRPLTEKALETAIRQVNEKIEGTI